MDAAPNHQLPPVKSAQHALKTVSTGGALQRKATDEAIPADAPIVSSPAEAGSAGSIIAEHTNIASRARTPVEPAAIPEGQMTLADLASYAGVHMPTGAAEPEDEEAVDESAGWSAGNFLKGQVAQQRRTGAGLAAAAMSKMTTRT